MDGVGGLLVVAGLMIMSRARSKPTSLLHGVHGDDRSVDQRALQIGYVIALAAMVFFGLGFVVKKWGLLLYPDTILGALIGSISALFGTLSLDAGVGRLGRRLRDNFAPVPWWFVAAGAAMSVGLLSQFAAFRYLPAWQVGMLQGTQGMWALLLGWIFIRQEERIDSPIVVSVLLVAAGIVLVGVGDKTL